jgi:hypothetical protein
VELGKTSVGVGSSKKMALDGSRKTVTPVLVMEVVHFADGHRNPATRHSSR